MGVKISREKEQNIKLSILYKIFKLPFFASPKERLKFYLDQAWIFGRLAHEQSVAHPFVQVEKHENNFLRSRIPLDSNILDIGCGNGFVISSLLDITQHITGVDYDHVSIESAKKRIPVHGITFLCQDVFDYIKENPDVKYDVIILSHVLEHIDDPESFLKALVHKARLFYIELPDFESSHLNVYRKAVHTSLIYTDADHVSEFDRNELKDLVSRAGLTVIAEEYRFGVIKFWCSSTV